MKSYEQLDKKAVNQSILDDAVTEFSKKKIAQVTVPAKKRKARGSNEAPQAVPSVTFKMYREMPVMALSHFQTIITNAAVESDTTGVFSINPTNLIVTTHAYIIENLTSLPLPMTTDEDGNAMPDVELTLSYGEYFRSESKVYEEVFQCAWGWGEEFCKEFANTSNMMAASLVGNTTDMTTLLKDDQFRGAILGQLKEILNPDSDAE